MFLIKLIVLELSTIIFIPKRSIAKMFIFSLSAFQSSVDGHMGCFCVLAIVNSAAVNIGERVSFSLMVFLGYMPSSGIVGSSVQFSRSVVSDSL